MNARTALLFTTLIACGGSAPPVETVETNKKTETTTTAVATTPTATATPVEPEKPKDPPGPPSVLSWGGPGMDLATPESVWVDDSGLVLIANINGKPDGADNNGYISAYTGPTGKLNAQKFIEGGKNKVTLNAPKGITVAKGIIYVADLDTVRLFDLKTGAPKSEVKIAGATFLNDVAIGPDGKVYVSDSGAKVGEKGFEKTGTDAVYLIERGKAKALAKSADLNGPNGLVVDAKGVWVNTLWSNEIYRLDAKGQKQDVTKVPTGMLDGFAVVGDTVYVSSWEASTIYKGKIGGSFEALFTGIKGPADFAYDKKNNWLLVPWFLADKVEAYSIK